MGEYDNIPLQPSSGAGTFVPATTPTPQEAPLSAHNPSPPPVINTPHPGISPQAPASWQPPMAGPGATHPGAPESRMPGPEMGFAGGPLPGGASWVTPGSVYPPPPVSWARPVLTASVPYPAFPDRAHRPRASPSRTRPVSRPTLRCPRYQQYLDRIWLLKTLKDMACLALVCQGRRRVFPPMPCREWAWVWAWMDRTPGQLHPATG